MDTGGQALRSFRTEIDDGLNDAGDRTGVRLDNAMRSMGTKPMVHWSRHFSPD
jgi:hypothetical protein